MSETIALEEFWNEIHHPPTPPRSEEAPAEPPDDVLATTVALMRPDRPCELLERTLEDLRRVDPEILREAARVMRLPQSRVVAMALIVGIVDRMVARLDPRDAPLHGVSFAELFQRGWVALFERSIE